MPRSVNIRRLLSHIASLIPLTAQEFHFVLAAGAGTAQAGQGPEHTCFSAGRRPPPLYYLRDPPFSLPHTLLIPHTAAVQDSEQRGTDLENKHCSRGLLPLLPRQGLICARSHFTTRQAQGFWSSPTPGVCRNPMWNRNSATSRQRSRTRKFQNSTRMDSRRSVQRFYLTVIKGEADDDSKPVNPGLGFTDNMHQIKLTKISLGAGQGRVRGKDVATRKPHVLGPSSNTTSTW